MITPGELRLSDYRLWFSYFILNLQNLNINAKIPHIKYNNAPPNESVILFNPFLLLSEYILYFRK